MFDKDEQNVSGVSFAQRRRSSSPVLKSAVAPVDAHSGVWMTGSSTRSFEEEACGTSGDEDRAFSAVRGDPEDAGTRTSMNSLGDGRGTGGGT